jgi:two-component system chemotaxis sensor kinase CheA
MIDKFRKKFLEEANEHIQSIESDLLKMEQAPDDPALIEKTFRAMHTLKGGGAMFGFNSISELTHNLETIFDQLRNHQTVLTDEILNISYEAVDQLKLLIEEDDLLNESVLIKQEELLHKIERLISKIPRKNPLLMNH